MTIIPRGEGTPSIIRSEQDGARLVAILFLATSYLGKQ